MRARGRGRACRRGRRQGRGRGRRGRSDALDELLSLAEFVTEGRNPANRRGVDSARVELENDLLPAGLKLVDTPGIGSIHSHNTEVALGFLPRVDAERVLRLLAPCTGAWPAPDRIPAEVTGGHVHVARERFDVERLRIVTIDPVAYTAQQREIA